MRLEKKCSVCEKKFEAGSVYQSCCSLECVQYKFSPISKQKQSENCEKMFLGAGRRRESKKNVFICTNCKRKDIRRGGKQRYCRECGECGDGRSWKKKEKLKEIRLRVERTGR